MDKVDAKTRETAVTLLDVLWTSKAPGEAAAKPSTVPAASATSSPSAAKAGQHLGTLPRPFGTNDRIHGAGPTTTTLRHGFDTKGWGNDTTVHRPLSTNPMPSKLASVDNDSRRAVVADCHVGKKSKAQKQERDTRTIQQQRRQSQSLDTAEASSTVLAAPITAVHKKENNHQNQNQEKTLRQKQWVENNQDQKQPQKFQQTGFPETTISSSDDSNITTPMMISMTSIGFGIDNSHRSQNDATDATIKAVQDAMERSTLRFQSFHSHSLQIKVKLGVPSVVGQTRCNDSTPGSNYSEPKKNQAKMQPMNVNLGRLISVLPRVIPILSIQVDVGGMFVPGEAPEAPSICAVVACIILESKSWLSSESKSHKNPSPQVSIAPPLPKCPSLPLETFTSGSPKRTLMEMSTSNETMTSLVQKEDPRQQKHQQILQINPPPTKLPPKCTTTTHQELVNEKATSQRWPSANSPLKHNTGSERVLREANLPPTSLLYRTQVTRPARSPTNQINSFGEKHSENRMSTLTSSNGYTNESGSATAGNKRRHQTQNFELNQKSLPPVVRHSSNRTTNSIELLAMISEQEIIRRKVLDTKGVSRATSEVSDHVASEKSPTSGVGKSSVGIGISGTFESLQGGETPEDSRHYERDDRAIKTEGRFTGTKHNITETFSSHQNNFKQIDTGDESNSNLGPKNSETLRMTDAISSTSEISHFTPPVIYQKKNVTEPPRGITTVGSLNLTKSPSVRQSPHLSSRHSNKLGRSCGGGRSISYSDYSNEHPLPEERDCWALSTRTTSSPVFPLKLHETLSQIEKDGFDDIIGWLPHGRSFKIHKQKEFTDIILPRYALNSYHPELLSATKRLTFRIVFFMEILLILGTSS